MIALLCFVAGIAIGIGAALWRNARIERANDARIGWSVFDHVVDVLGDPKNVDTQMPAFVWTEDSLTDRDCKDMADQYRRVLKKLSNEH